MRARRSRCRSRGCTSTTSSSTSRPPPAKRTSKYSPRPSLRMSMRGSPRHGFSATLRRAPTVPKRRSSVSLDIASFLSSCRRWLRARAGRVPLLRPPPVEEWRSTQQRACSASDARRVSFSPAERCFLSHSPTLLPWIAAPPDAHSRIGVSSYVEEPWSPNLGVRSKKCRQKLTHNYQRYFTTRHAEGLSLSGGASIRSKPCSSWASPFCSDSLLRLLNDEGDLPVALASSCYAASFLAHPPLSEG